MHWCDVCWFWCWLGADIVCFNVCVQMEKEIERYASPSWVCDIAAALVLLLALLLILLLDTWRERKKERGGTEGSRVRESGWAKTPRLGEQRASWSAQACGLAFARIGIFILPMDQFGAVLLTSFRLPAPRLLLMVELQHLQSDFSNCPSRWWVGLGHVSRDHISGD